MMSGASFSSQWYRIAGLHPQLHRHVRVVRQPCRGDAWYLLLDADAGHSVRLNEAAWAFVGCCDGHISVDALWEQLLQQAPESAPTQHEIVALLVQLYQAGMLRCELTPDTAALFRAHERRQRSQLLQQLNPLALRLPLGAPGPWLKKLDPLLPWLFGRAALCLWLVLLLAGLTVALGHAAQLAAEGEHWLATPFMLFLTWASYPFIKAVHELAHALAVRRFGGEVGKVGIALLMLTPAPYVDASAASAFVFAWQRALVSAAGILAELALAALALLLWRVTAPGLVHDLALVVAFSCGISSLLFNGNPLLRFDGYYVLSDALELPNLASRSRRWWLECLQRGCGLPPASPLICARGELPWLMCYQAASWLYRVLLSFVIVGWLGGFSMLLGLALAAWMAFTLLLRPLGQSAHWLWNAALPDHRRTRVLGAVAGGATLLLLLLLALPLPYATKAQGVVWLPEDALLRAGTDGFLQRWHVGDGQTVRRGQTVASLADPVLESEVERLHSRLRQVQDARYHALQTDPTPLRSLDGEEQALRSQLALKRSRLAARELGAGRSGRVVLPAQADLEGSFVLQGTLLGYVLNRDDDMRIRIALSEQDVAQVSAGTRAIEVRLAEQPGQVFSARLVRMVPASGTRLPHAALGSFAGGEQQLDPQDAQHLTTREPVAVLDVVLPGVRPERLAARAWVRFEHDSTPLAQQWGRQLRQLFLGHFNAGA
ncbi:MAG: PqqD family peptide modification chaperone [Rubrivivax sp.]